jgi:iron(III) transport system permease protein
MGYALPGTVIAIGVLIPFNWLDHRVGLSLQKWFQTDSALIFSGSLFILIFAYLVRFLSVSMGSVEAGLGKVGNSIDSAAKSLGSSSMKLIRKIHLPMIKASFLSAMLMVFVDVMKELPATLILRPFNYDTLAVRVYHLASDERLADAAAPSLLIVVVGIFPVIIISRIISRARPGS